MKRPRSEDQTRRHVLVTAGLSGVAALVLAVLEDPANRMAPGTGTVPGVAAAGKAVPPAVQEPYLRFEAALRPTGVARVGLAPGPRPVAAGKSVAILPRKQ